VLTCNYAAWKSCPDIPPTYEGYNAERPLLIAAACDFEIYRSPNAGHETRRFELISLHHLEVPTSKKLCLDGFLCIGNVRCYVQGLAIQDSSIEGYGDDESPSIVSYVQTELAKKDTEYDIWVRLSKPSKEYKRFHDPFIWIAQLAKHVLDFIDEQPKRAVGLDNFRADFHTWLSSRFPQNAALWDWHQAYLGRIDFRTGVIRYIEFLYHQAFNLPDAKHLLDQPLWSECMVRGLTAIKMQAQVVQQTLATPSVYYCFKDMYFGSKMLAMSISLQVKTEQERRKSKLRFPSCQASATEDMSWTDPPSRPYNNDLVQVGDVVTFDPTDDDKEFWGAADRQWFAYVQRTEAQQDRGQRLFVLYLYRPRETNIFNAKYPFPNELFFSDNCNCTEGELLSTEINGKCNTAWVPSTIPTDSFFVRQTYVTQDSAFVSLKKAHMVCICMKQKESNVKDYQAGDTVYVKKTVSGHKILEPVVIRQIDNASGTVTVRRLLRLARDCPSLLSTTHRTHEIAANELVLTDEYERIPESQVDRRCHVRFVPKHHLFLGQVPFPYNRGGAGDLWIISMGLATSDEGQRLMYLARLPDRFREGRNLLLPVAGQSLKGLSVFSGGGSLDRGLQEGGAVDFQTVVDFSPEAMHTHSTQTLKIILRCDTFADRLTTI
jgi:DNA (cytosine-5)-methyltransferase 1